MPMIKSKKPPVIELLTIIVNSNVGEKTIKLLNSLDINLQILSLGKGTGDSILADYFGVDKNEKDVIFALIKLKDSPRILSLIDEKLCLDKKNSGIAFTVPIKSAMYSLLEKMGFSF